MFKVGDKAIVVKNLWGHDWRKGEIVTITELTVIQPIIELYDTYTKQYESKTIARVQEYRAYGNDHLWYILEPELQRIIPKLSKLIHML